MTSPEFVSAERITRICLSPSFERYLKVINQQDNAQVTAVAEPLHARPDTLSFVSTLEQFEMVRNAKSNIVIALDRLKLDEQSVNSSTALYSTSNISAAMALVLPLFDKKAARFESGIHATAFIHPTAQIGSEVRIGPFVFVGPNARIGDQAWIGAHAVVETGASIGAKSILHPHAFIGAQCQIGQFCEIHPGAVIGADGFGFALGSDQKRHKIPQLGIVVLEDFVEIGANCTIDRATLGETRIGEGTKFDNLCHVAHNCKIGKHNVFAGGFMIAGSSEIGDSCTFGGGTLVTDHVKVGSQIIVGGLSGVTKDVLKPGAYAGYPLEPLKDAMRTIANKVHLTSMRKQLAQLRKHLGLEKEDS